MAGHLLSNMPNVIMKAMMMYDFKGIIFHTLRFSASISWMRRIFLNSILTNMLENSIIVTMLPMTMTTEVVSRFVHDATPILQTFKPAISQIIQAMKASVFVFIYMKIILFSTCFTILNLFSIGQTTLC